jgi:flavodoxin I
MSTVIVVYGSSTGATEGIARTIAESLEATTLLDVAQLTEEKIAGFRDASVVLLGSSTWGFGDLQDDWHVKLPLLKDADLSGVKVGIFGTGDQVSYPDTFVDSIGIIAEVVEQAGATLIGQTAPDSCTFDESRAIRDGKFLGLVIDEDNQGDMTEERVSHWIAQVKSEAGI